ncbi:hypothetical protein ABF86_04230 [Nitrosomonas sp. GH22]|nr:hypothetical protein [Nitrosomonas sp. GH22]
MILGNEGRRATSAARNEECLNGHSNTSPFIPILGKIELTGISPLIHHLARVSVDFFTLETPLKTVPHTFNGFDAFFEGEF